PLTDNGFAGILTRFPHLGATKAAQGSGSKVVQSFAYGNVVIIGLDDSDVSALDTVNNGYTEGKQTTWLIEQLKKYRSPGSGVDFIVVFFHHCPYCSGGPCSDGGDRYAWQPIFDRFDVDLVINGHNHLYERVYPMRNNEVQAHVAPGGKIAPAVQGTTYICTGGGERYEALARRERLDSALSAAQSVQVELPGAFSPAHNQEVSAYVDGHQRRGTVP
ncbi:MAG: metallophosphoesterase family protein, partial [Trebonia sp.]